MKTSLTEMEIMILKAARNNEFADAGNGGVPWVFSVIDNSGLDAKVARGVISSLVKKDFIGIEDYEGDGNPNDMCLFFLENAKKLVNQGVI